MFFNQVFSYLRENQETVSLVAAGILLLIILIEVIRTRQEVHRICRKIRKYFDVIMTEDETAPAPDEDEEDGREEVPVYQTADSFGRRREERLTAEERIKRQRDAELLMDVIQEVF